jgi:hypothetical protein
VESHILFGLITSYNRNETPFWQQVVIASAQPMRFDYAVGRADRQRTVSPITNTEYAF